MATFAIGDVHGCLRALHTLLDHLPFQDGDQIVFLGDIIDRGPDSRGVIDTILAWRERRMVQVIQGNHEEMLFWARQDRSVCESWLSYGGRETLLSYGWDQRDPFWPELIPESHWRFLSTDLLDCVEANHDMLVHAAVDPDLPIAEQNWSEMRWVKWNSPRRHLSGKRVVCGHTHQPSGLPLANENAICIDTWVYGSGWLTALELDSPRYYQANQQGEFRTKTLPDATTSTSEAT